MESKLMALGVVLALAVMGFAGFSRTSVAGSDPEPWIDTTVETHFDKGPGWPAGWTEPPAPTEIPPDLLEEFSIAKSFGPPEERPERLELRVLQPMPGWTREYPYRYRFDSLLCGKTMYAYAYPEPDRDVIATAFGQTYSVGRGSTGANCEFGPVIHIKFVPPPSAEEMEQFELDLKVNESIGFAQGPLEDCHPDTTNGTQGNIYVCFNAGDASALFDVPAYLDLAVGRVRVPVRFVSEMMRAQVNWDETTETVTIHFPEISRDVIMTEPREGYTPLEMWVENDWVMRGSHYKYVVRTVTQAEKTIVLTVGKDVALVDGKEMKIDAPPVVLPPGRTMVPVRFIAEAMGAKVYWVGQEPIFKKDDGTLGGTYQVHIFTHFWPYYEAPNWFLETRALKF